MTTYLINLADLGLTLCSLRLGVKEANPLMQCVPVMVVYKTAAVGALCWWLSRRPEKMARYGLRIAAVVYAGLAVYHITALIFVLFIL